MEVEETTTEEVHWAEGSRTTKESLLQIDLRARWKIYLSNFEILSILKDLEKFSFHPGEEWFIYNDHNFEMIDIIDGDGRFWKSSLEFWIFV